MFCYGRACCSPVQDFRQPLVASNQLTPAELDAATGNVHELLALHLRFVERLRARVAAWTDEATVADIFIDSVRPRGKKHVVIGRSVATADHGGGPLLRTPIGRRWRSSARTTASSRSTRRCSCSWRTWPASSPWSSRRLTYGTPWCGARGRWRRSRRLVHPRGFPTVCR